MPGPDPFIEGVLTRVSGYVRHNKVTGRPEDVGSYTQTRRPGSPRIDYYKPAKKRARRETRAVMDLPVERHAEGRAAEILGDQLHVDERKAKGHADPNEMLAALNALPKASLRRLKADGIHVYLGPGATRRAADALREQMVYAKELRAFNANMQTDGGLFTRNPGPDGGNGFLAVWNGDAEFTVQHEVGHALTEEEWADLDPAEMLAAIPQFWRNTVAEEGDDYDWGDPGVVIREFLADTYAYLVHEKTAIRILGIETGPKALELIRPMSAFRPLRAKIDEALRLARLMQEAKPEFRRRSRHYMPVGKGIHFDYFPPREPMTEADALIEGILTRISGYLRQGRFVRRYTQRRKPAAPVRWSPGFPHRASGGATPLRSVEVKELHAKWAELNSQLHHYVDNPADPEATRLIDGQLEIGQEIHHRNKAGAHELSGHAHDVVIVGAGPAGLTAAINGATEGLDTVLIDASDRPGGQAAMSSRIENVLGFPVGIRGSELAANGARQAERVGADMRFGIKVESLHYDADTGLKTLRLSSGEEVQAHAVVVAGGVQFSQLKDMPDAEGVFYGNSAEIKQYTKSGDPVVIVGGANSAGQAGVDLAQAGRKVAMVIRGSIRSKMSRYLENQLRAHPNAEVIERAEVETLGVAEDGSVDGIRLKDGRTLGAKAVGLFIGSLPQARWGDFVLDEKGYIKVGGEGRQALETSMPGVFAAGDVRQGSIHRVAQASADGQAAISYVHGVLPERAEEAAAEPPPREMDEADRWMVQMKALDREVLMTGFDHFTEAKRGSPKWWKKQHSRRPRDYDFERKHRRAFKGQSGGGRFVHKTKGQPPKKQDEPLFGYNDDVGAYLSAPAAARAAGANAARMVVAWNAQNFDEIDRAMAAFKRQKIEPIIPVWGASPPPSPEQYAASVANIARRYPRATIELWNEPNLPMFGALSVDQTVALCRAAYDAVKAVNPKAKIIGPSIAPVNYEGTGDFHAYAGAVYNQLPKDIEFGGHIYLYGDDPIKKLKEEIKWMKSLGRPIHITEVGVPRREGQTVKQFARANAEVYEYLAGLDRVESIIFHRLRSSGPGDPAGERLLDARWQLYALGSGGQRTPLFRALKRARERDLRKGP